MSHFSVQCSALLATTLIAGFCHGDVETLEVGSFYFRGSFETIYEGDFAEYLAVSTEGPYERFVSEVHLGRLAEDLNLGSIVWLQLSGPNTETSQVNPGADIDLFAAPLLPDGVLARYEYEGPNPLYQGASSESIGAEVAAVDFEMGDVDADDSFVSLGTAGHLFMWFEGSMPGGDDGGVDDGMIDITGDLQPTDGRIWEVSLVTNDPIVGITESDLWVRLHEVAPISEWVRLKVGYLEVDESVEGDLDGDGIVAAGDLGLLLVAWGPNPESMADLNNDGMVNGIDLGIMLQLWTP